MFVMAIFISKFNDRFFIVPVQYIFGRHQNLILSIRVTFRDRLKTRDSQTTLDAVIFFKWVSFQRESSSTQLHTDSFTQNLVSL